MDLKIFDEKLSKLITEVLANFNDHKNNYKPKTIQKILVDFPLSKTTKTKLTVEDVSKTVKSIKRKITVKERKETTIWDPIGEDDPQIKILIWDYFYKIEKWDLTMEILSLLKENIPDEIRFGYGNFSIDHPEPERIILSGLIINILIKKINEELTDEIINDYLETFIKDIFERKIVIYNFDFLKGIEIETDEIKLSNNIQIKKATKEDFETLENFANFHFSHTIYLPKLLLKTITPIRFDKNERLNLTDFYLIIRLFRFAVIYPYDRYRYRKTAYGQAMLTNIPVKKHIKQFKNYKLKKEEIPELKTFFNAIFGPLQEIKKKKNYEKNPDYRSLVIALSRYNLALFSNLGLDQQFMFAVMGMETLFSTESEKTSTSLKLSLRIPKFLNQLGYRVESSQKNIKAAYKFRNKVVHGLKYNSKWQEKISELFPIILNFLRITIAFRLLTLDYPKEKFVKLLDQSLLIKSKEEKLRKLVSKIQIHYESLFKPILLDYEKVEPIIVTLSVEYQ